VRNEGLVTQDFDYYGISRKGEKMLNMNVLLDWKYAKGSLSCFPRAILRSSVFPSDTKCIFFNR
jgi:hypothetical protein